MTVLNGFTLQSIYDQAYLAELGVPWDAFAAAPHAMLDAVGQHDALDVLANGYRPLLPSQAKLRRQLIAEWERDGTWDDSLRARRTAHGGTLQTPHTNAFPVTLLA